MQVGPERIITIHLFASLPPEEIAQIAAAAEERVAPSGQAVAAADDFGHALYAIEGGEVDVLVDGEIVRRLGPGDVFGEIALVRSGRRTATAVAATDCRLLTWFKRDVWRLESSAPRFAEALRAHAAANLAGGEPG